MSKEVYTYADLSKLSESKQFAQIKYFPQITVSADLRKSLKGSIDIDRVEGLFSKDNGVLVAEFSVLKQLVDEEWNTDQAKFNESIILSEFLRNKLETAVNDKEKQNWLIGCIRNLSAILSSIVLLEQANVKPEDLEAKSDKNVILFLEAWKYLVDRDPVLLNYRARMKELNTKSVWKPILSKVFHQPNFDFSTIIFNGFYYITPYQQRIINLLDEAGYNLIFLIPYDDRYPFVYEIWDHTYTAERGFVDKKDWHIEIASQNDAFGDIFQGKENVSIPNKLSIREYATVMEFVNDIKKIKKEGYSVYSSDFKTANKILKEYYPEEYGDRKILSYPIGLFVSTLNHMWDSDLQTIVLEADALIECFASGWLAVEGISGKQYIQDLTYILPFFAGCRTVTEWEKRIDFLKEIDNEIIIPFLTELDADESVSRWQEAIGNPLSNFSMFAVEKEKLDIILSLIYQLLNMAKELFGDNKTVRVSDHIHKLDSILKEHEISDEMYDEERKLVGSIFEELGKPSDFNTMCFPSDIAHALDLYICGKFEEGEVQTNRVGLVYPLYFVDAACIKNKSKVHICMCDVNSLPGGNKEYIWPLTSELIHDCFQRTNNQLVQNIIQIMESTALCNRYFIYCGLKNKDVQLSWVSCINDKLLAPSPYIKLICEETGIKLIPAKRNTLTFDRVIESAYGVGRIEEYDNEKTPKEIIKEAKMAYALCPMKYTLGYVVEKYPTFQSDFQQNYTLNAFISAVYSLLKGEGITVNQVYNNTMDLFPSLRKVEKRQVLDYIAYDRRENDFDYENRTSCGGSFYTDERLKLHYPNQQVREVTLGRYGKLLTPDGRKGMNLYEVMEANSDEEKVGNRDVIKSACVFCPHIGYCRNAIYAADQENYYD